MRRRACRPQPEQVEEYKAKLSLDAVSQPYITAGIDRFGGMVGGGIAFQFSDMLGNHNLFAQISADTYGTGASELLKNTGAALLLHEHVEALELGRSGSSSRPTSRAAMQPDRATINGEPAVDRTAIIQRQINQGVNGMVAYPFSQTARVEFGGGFTRTSFEQQVETTAYLTSHRPRDSDERTTEDLADPLSMPSVSTALVTDRSIFGATSPVAGARSRFEVSPTFGDLRMTSALLDYRHYFMPARFYTIAVRGLHYGRYGAGGEDRRLDPALHRVSGVRARLWRSIRSRLANVDRRRCARPIDRLVGSRMLVGNVEFRFPLLRPFRGVDSSVYGPLPVEVAFFLDSGVTWNKGQKPSFLNGTREPVTSGGITLRTNLLGFAVAQIDYARPFDRPGTGLDLGVFTYAGILTRRELADWQIRRLEIDGRLADWASEIGTFCHLQSANLP